MPTTNKSKNLLDKGVQFHRAGDLLKAKEYYDTLIESNPNDPEALHLLGVLQHQQGDHHQAVQLIEQALKVSSNSHFYNNLAASYLSLGNKTAALVAYQKAIELDPQYYEAYFNCANILVQIDPLLAIQCYQKALTIKPNSQEIINNLANAYVVTKNVTAAKELWQEQLNHDPNNFQCNYNLANLYLQQQQYQLAQHHYEIALANHQASFKNANDFDIYCNLAKVKDNFTHLIEKPVDCFTDLSMLDHISAAKKIAADNIDILIDLAGFTGTSRLHILAHRPAKIQAHWLGYSASLGCDFIDYWIADPTLVPLTQQQYFTEEILYLNNFIATDPFDIIYDYKNIPLTLPSNQFIFCSICAPYRINESTLSCWLNILKQTTNSSLLLYSPNEIVKNNIIKFVEQSTVDPNRIIFTPSNWLTKTSPLKHVDLWLDPFTISGGTGTLASLSANLPVLSYPSDKTPTRTTSAILTACRLNQLIADSPQQYQEIAIDLCQNPKKTDHLKHFIQENKHDFAIFQPSVFIKDFEHKLQVIYEKNL